MMASPTSRLVDGLVVASERVVARRVFTSLLVTATLLPFVLAPLLTGTSLFEARGYATLLAVLALSGAHQPSSWLLYADGDARRVVAGHRLFFFAGPLCIVAACVLFFRYAPAPLHAYFWIFFGVVSIHHYQKQNLGVFSLLAPVLGGGRMSLFERRLIYAGGICGMAVFGFPLDRTIFQDTPFRPLESGLGVAAATGIIVLAGIALSGLVRGRSEAGAAAPQPWRTLLLLVLVTYYWPLFLIGDRLTAFAMFAAGHGLQYLVIMSYVAADTAGTAPGAAPGVRPVWFALARVAFFAAVTFAFAAGLRAVGSLPGGGSAETSAQYVARLAGALVLSVTLVHYWVDARMWKMSQSDSRRFMQSKLAFLF